ncbi:DDE-type integrase/transposase/recombinase [Exiguobacterium sp. K1]|uniref:DDE-type integrase/transposase/recombinase n=1 Tax=Exiguobacterium sp. K1 TaxID=2980105 RepID=UPI0039A686EB
MHQGPSKWHYVCVFVDLFNREIIGHSMDKRKHAQLVHRAFVSIPHDLRRIRMFHTDRGREFNNRLIEDTLHTFATSNHPLRKLSSLVLTIQDDIQDTPSFQTRNEGVSTI